MSTDSIFVCRVCGSRQFFHAGVTNRGFLAQGTGEREPNITYEMVHLYGCGSCTALFLLPHAFSAVDRIEPPEEDDLLPKIHPSHEAEGD